MKKIKCAVYLNEYEWGGGHYFLPFDNHKEIRMILRTNHSHQVAKKPIGVFEFEEDFLNTVFIKLETVTGDFIYWDNTWCE